MVVELLKTKSDKPDKSINFCIMAAALWLLNGQVDKLSYVILQRSSFSITLEQDSRHSTGELPIQLQLLPQISCIRLIYSFDSGDLFDETGSELRQM